MKFYDVTIAIVKYLHKIHSTTTIERNYAHKIQQLHQQQQKKY